MGKVKEERTEELYKLYILIVGAVASGKTTLALNLAKAFRNCFYFDKDDLGMLSEVVFECAGWEYDRHGDRFKEHVRDPEYDVSERITLNGLRFSDCVVYNAPYTGEISREASGEDSKRLCALYDAVHARGGKLMIVFVESDRKTVKAHLVKRGKEDPEAYKRDKYIYDDLDSFVDTQNLKAPEPGAIRHTDSLFVFDSRRPEASFSGLLQALSVETGTEYDAGIDQQLRLPQKTNKPTENRGG